MVAAVGCALMRSWGTITIRRACSAALLIVCCLLGGVGAALAETQSVIDPTVVPAPLPDPAAVAKKPAQSDAEIKRARQRADAEQRKREKAEARARAAEKTAEDLRAAEEARQAAAEQAAAKVAEKAAAAKAAAQKKAAARQAAARTAAARDAAEKEAIAKEAAIREEAARELAARQAATREAAQEAARENAAREAAAKEAAARELAAKEAVARAAVRPGTVFRECADCPEMVWLPKGEFQMGETPAVGVAGPVHTVKINYPLAAGRFEVTFAEWDACVAAGGCRHWPEDQGWGRGRRPVINVSWVDAQEYTAWLSARTGKHYRLLSEAEWEYAARAGTQTRYSWGNDVGHNRANCYGCGSRWDGRQTSPVGSFEANAFGLYDMLGNASEWVEDCYHGSYRDAPADGSAWEQNCPADMRDKRVMRGGAWQYPSQLTRPAFRTAFSNGYYDLRIGFRVARAD
jgi:formylglycine-generating enzyme required for sulfatase activity